MHAKTTINLKILQKKKTTSNVLKLLCRGTWMSWMCKQSAEILQQILQKHAYTQTYQT